MLVADSTKFCQRGHWDRRGKVFGTGEVLLGLQQHVLGHNFQDAQVHHTAELRFVGLGSVQKAVQNNVVGCSHHC